MARTSARIASEAAAASTLSSMANATNSDNNASSVNKTAAASTIIAHVHDEAVKVTIHNHRDDKGCYTSGTDNTDDDEDEDEASLSDSDDGRSKSYDDSSSTADEVDEASSSDSDNGRRKRYNFRKMNKGNVVKVAKKLVKKLAKAQTMIVKKDKDLVKKKKELVKEKGKVERINVRFVNQKKKLSDMTDSKVTLKLNHQETVLRERNVHAKTEQRLTAARDQAVLWRIIEQKRRKEVFRIRIKILRRWKE